MRVKARAVPPCPARRHRAQGTAGAAGDGSSAGPVGLGHHDHCTSPAPSTVPGAEQAPRKCGLRDAVWLGPSTIHPWHRREEPPRRQHLLSAWSSHWPAISPAAISVSQDTGHHLLGTGHWPPGSPVRVKGCGSLISELSNAIGERSHSSSLPL